MLPNAEYTGCNIKAPILHESALLYLSENISVLLEFIGMFLKLYM